MNGAHTNDTLQEVARTLAPERSAHADDIVLNPELYARVRTVHEQKEGLALDPEQEMLLEETHKAFVRRGAALDDDAKARLREINSALAELSQGAACRRTWWSLPPRRPTAATWACCTWTSSPGPASASARG